jgi:hypothetical protein
MRSLFRTVVLALLLGGLALPAMAQSQAINGTIEGTVRDNSGGVLPGVTVTVTNTDTGTNRVAITNASGLYRAPLLPLGTYTVTAELEGFKKFEQVGISLSAGQTAVIDVVLGVGNVSEVVSVTADAPIVDPAKIDLGRNLNEREVKNLPLVSRNPYNFALLQPGVSGFENSEFGVPRFSANGTLLRVNYQIDGNTNTEKDRAGLRLLPVSEVMVREVKVITSGYAPEFGQTTGLVYNAITPSGTNTVHGEVSYRFRRKWMSARPFFLNSATKPDTFVNTVTATLGGPVIKDKLHYYFGYERTSRDLSADRAITITAANAAAIGLTTAEASGVMPAEQAAHFIIGKGEYQLNQANRLTFRQINFINDSPNNVGGGSNSTQWATDFTDSMFSSAGQLITTFGANKLNELRVQYAGRHQSRATNALSGTGPAIVISGVANFGGPYSAASDAGYDFTQKIFQVVDNATYLRGNHSFKVGGDVQIISDTRTRTPQLQYTFSSVANYLLAQSGTNGKAYSTFTQFIGNPDFDMTTGMYGVFIQDDWKIARSVKVLFGVRYDVFDLPDADSTALYEGSRTYSTDKNNWSPRVGGSWTIDDKTVLRASSGLMYDQPLLAAYEQAGQVNGVRAILASMSPTTAGAPDFPNSLASAASYNAGTQSIYAIADGFQVMRTWQNNIQIDRALGKNYSVALGFVYVKGYNLPVIFDTNLTGPTGFLSDGRPIYSTTVSSSTRLNPSFNHIYSVQSIGDSTYKGMSVQFTKRYADGLQFDLSYSLGKGEDNAPLTSVLSVQGDDGVSDPSNLERDRGPNIMDQRHSFAGSIVWAPEISSGTLLDTIVNNNQIGVALTINSGLPQNIRSSSDLNKDGVSADRPSGIARNSVYLPARYNVDVRYSRSIPITKRYRAELQAEFKNLFNTQQTSGLSNLRIVATDATGVPTGTVPTKGSDFSSVGRSGYEARQMSFGCRFRF